SRRSWATMASCHADSRAVSDMASYVPKPEPSLEYRFMSLTRAIYGPPDVQQEPPAMRWRKQAGVERFRFNLRWRFQSETGHARRVPVTSQARYRRGMTLRTTFITLFVASAVLQMHSQERFSFFHASSPESVERM